MDELEKLDQLIDMLGNSITDVSSCEEDLRYLDQDFLTRYPEINNPTLSLETKRILEKIKSDFMQFRRRNFVKTVFSSIEGILFAMKRILLNHSERLTDEEIIKLQEYRVVGSNENRLKKKSIYLKSEENIKFVIKTYEKCITRKIVTNLNSDDWERYTKSISIRNRITHPKISGDLFISTEEVNMVKQAHDWFFSVFNNLANSETDTY